MLEDNELHNSGQLQPPLWCMGSGSVLVPCYSRHCQHHPARPITRLELLHSIPIKILIKQKYEIVWDKIDQYKSFVFRVLSINLCFITSLTSLLPHLIIKYKPSASKWNHQLQPATALGSLRGGRWANSGMKFGKFLNGKKFSMSCFGFSVISQL